MRPPFLVVQRRAYAHGGAATKHTRTGQVQVEAILLGHEPLLLLAHQLARKRQRHPRVRAPSLPSLSLSLSLCADPRAPGLTLPVVAPRSSSEKNLVLNRSLFLAEKRRMQLALCAIQPPVPSRPPWLSARSFSRGGASGVDQGLVKAITMFEKRESGDPPIDRSWGSPLGGLEEEGEGEGEGEIDR